MREVTAYESKDGRLFRRAMDAQRAEAELEIREWASKKGIGRGGEWTAQMVAEVMLEDAQSLGLLLQRIAIFDAAPRGGASC